MGFHGATALDVGALALNPHRAPDPWLTVTPSLVVRRLAPDSQKLDIAPGHEPAFLNLLGAMGGELANIHASAGQAAAVAAALENRPRQWLAREAQILAESVRADHAAWVSRM